MVDMGMDMMSVKDFLEDKCIHEENAEMVLDYMNNPQYMNALKNAYIPPHNPAAGMGGGYNYVPNQAMGNAMPQ